MKYLILVVFLSGCAMFASEIDQVSDRIGDGVDRYCSELDQDERAEVRAEVNPTPAGAKIKVTCPGDE